MFKRILIPLDGSILAERAIPHAEKFARIFGSTIVLLRVLEVSSEQENQSPIDALSWQIHKTEADRYLQSIASRIREHLQTSEGNVGNRVEYGIREGRTAENIIDFARHENIDLLVISSHGSGGLSRWSISNVIQKVIDLIYLPLLIVRSYLSPEETDDQIFYRRILLPMDSSLRAECVLPAAIMLAQGGASQAGASVNVLSETEEHSPEHPLRDDIPLKTTLFLTGIITPPEIPIPRPYPFEIRELSNQLLTVSRKAVMDYLHIMKRRLPVEVEVRVVESSNVSSAIQMLSNEEDMDLVLMSAHGYSGQFTHPYGSVTRNYIDRGAKSILVIQDIPLSMVLPTASAVTAMKFEENNPILKAEDHSYLKYKQSE